MPNDASAEEREFVRIGLKAGVPKEVLVESLLIARLTGKPVSEVRDQLFKVEALIQDEFRNYRDVFNEELTKRVASDLTDVSEN